MSRWIAIGLLLGSSAQAQESVVDACLQSASDYYLMDVYAAKVNDFSELEPPRATIRIKLSEDGEPQGIVECEFKDGLLVRFCTRSLCFDETTPELEELNHLISKRRSSD